MHIATVTQALWPKGNGPDRPQVYALLDGARDYAIAPAIWLSDLPYTCLYAGHLSRSLSLAAPYLVQLAPESRFFSMLMTEGWGKAWGIFISAEPDVTLKVLRRHFRTLLRVTDEQGRTLAFRFYDPRVLRVYMATSPKQNDIFGPVGQFFMEDENSEGILHFSKDQGADRHSMERNSAGPMVFRKDEMDQFALMCDGYLIEKIIDFIRSMDAGKIIRGQEGVARELIRSAMLRARSYKLSWDISIAGYVLLEFDHGPSFAAQPSVAEALHRIQSSANPDEAFFFFRSQFLNDSIHSAAEDPEDAN